MEEKLSFLQERIREDSLYEGCQYIAGELRENLLGAQMMLQVFRESSGDSPIRKDAIVQAEARLAWALQVINVLFVAEFMKKRLAALEQ